MLSFYTKWSRFLILLATSPLPPFLFSQWDIHATLSIPDGHSGFSCLELPHNFQHLLHDSLGCSVWHAAVSRIDDNVLCSREHSGDKLLLSFGPGLTIEQDCWGQGSITYIKWPKKKTKQTKTEGYSSMAIPSTLKTTEYMTKTQWLPCSVHWEAAHHSSCLSW